MLCDDVDEDAGLEVSPSSCVADVAMEGCVADDAMEA